MQLKISLEIPKMPERLFSEYKANLVLNKNIILYSQLSAVPENENSMGVLQNLSRCSN